MDSLIDVVTALTPSVSAQDLVVLSINPYSGDPQFNTRANISWKRSSNMYGQFSVLYNRLDLTGLERTVYHTNETKASDLITKINVMPITTYERFDGTRYVYLEKDDIVDINIVTGANRPPFITIPIVSSSKLFLGQLKVNLLS